MIPIIPFLAIPSSPGFTFVLGPGEAADSLKKELGRRARRQHRSVADFCARESDKHFFRLTGVRLDSQALDDYTQKIGALGSMVEATQKQPMLVEMLNKMESELPPEPELIAKKLRRKRIFTQKPVNDNPAILDDFAEISNEVESIGAKQKRARQFASRHGLLDQGNALAVSGDSPGNHRAPSTPRSGRGPMWCGLPDSPSGVDFDEKLGTANHEGRVVSGRREHCGLTKPKRKGEEPETGLELGDGYQITWLHECLECWYCLSASMAGALKLLELTNAETPNELQLQEILRKRNPLGLKGLLEIREQDEFTIRRIFADPAWEHGPHNLWDHAVGFEVFRGSRSWNPEKDKTSLKEEIREYLRWFINRNLVHYAPAVVSARGHLELHPYSLLGLLWCFLAQRVAQGTAPTVKCECGTWYEPKDGHQTHCDKACANKFRQKRYRMKSKKQTLRTPRPRCG